MLATIVPTVPRFEASPFRRISEIVLEESGVQVIVNGCPGVRLVLAVTEVMTFVADAYAKKAKRATDLANDNILLEPELTR